MVLTFEYVSVFEFQSMWIIDRNLAFGKWNSML